MTHQPVHRGPAVLVVLSGLVAAVVVAGCSGGGRAGMAASAGPGTDTSSLAATEPAPGENAEPAASPHESPTTPVIVVMPAATESAEPLAPAPPWDRPFISWRAISLQEAVASVPSVSTQTCAGAGPKGSGDLPLRWARVIYRPSGGDREAESQAALVTCHGLPAQGYVIRAYGADRREPLAFSPAGEVCFGPGTLDEPEPFASGRFSLWLIRHSSPTGFTHRVVCVGESTGSEEFRPRTVDIDDPTTALSERGGGDSPRGYSDAAKVFVEARSPFDAAASGGTEPLSFSFSIWTAGQELSQPARGGRVEGVYKLIFGPDNAPARLTVSESGWRVFPPE